MTAEIAIMNKTAVALAADSAVTISNDRNQKIYNSVNKLFSLSRYQPVGVMIYGGAQFMGLPWETIIKVFRKELGKRKFNYIKEYVDCFLKFLHKKNYLFTSKIQTDYFRKVTLSYYYNMRKEIDDKVKKITPSVGGITNEVFSKIVSDVINKHHQTWDKTNYLPRLNKKYRSEIIKRYKKDIHKSVKDIFEKIPLDKNMLKKLEEISSSIFTKDNFASSCSGIVIAGFGEKEVFPKLYSLSIESIIHKKLKYKIDNESTLSTDNRASIIPFAQSEMVHLFMEGVDPYYESTTKKYLSEIFSKLPKDIVSGFPKLSETEKQELESKLLLYGKGINEDFTKKMKDYKRSSHINPVVDAVANLPKDELAIMAETLVNITSFKRRVSLSAETVGGPIDVIVISKGDGLIWIKRKHYFKPELNPQYFENFINSSEEKNEK